MIVNIGGSCFNAANVINIKYVECQNESFNNEDREYLEKKFGKKDVYKATRVVLLGNELYSFFWLSPEEVAKEINRQIKEFENE